MCPFEAVLSHIEMYCDFTDVSSQEGNVSYAINHVVCTITKGLGMCAHTTAGQAGKHRGVNKGPRLCAMWFRIKGKLDSNQFYFFLSDFMNNVT